VQLHHQSAYTPETGTNQLKTHIVRDRGGDLFDFLHQG
jgi:hypothetical protein